MSSGKESKFTRRKFTITEDLDDELEQLAANHYQGNVSLCLRQAITDHRETLNGRGRLTLKRLATNIDKLREKVGKLIELVETTTEHIQARDTPASPSSTGFLSTDNAERRAAHQVITVIEDASGPVRTEDIIEQAELKPMTVRQALGYLIDRGYIVESQSDPPRYQLAQMTSPQIA